MEFKNFGNDISIENIRKNPYEIEQRYLAEHTLLNSVSMGDYEASVKNIEYLFTFKMEARSEDKLRNIRHMMVILNTLCRKHIELVNHIHPLYIDDVSYKIAKRLQEIEDLQSMENIYKEILRRYCLLVQNHSRKGYGDTVKNVVAYIDFHYYEDLSLSTLAIKFSLSRSYLSSLFKKEVGITLTDYLHKARIRQAIFLLNSSHLSIGDIATACGYTDFNYFIRVFKKLKGISPKTYQKRIGN